MTSHRARAHSFGHADPVADLVAQISIHIRGPLRLKRFAAYSAGDGSDHAKRGVHRRYLDEHAHGHAHAHQHEKRAVGDVVHANINGQDVSWVNEWSGEAAPAPQPAGQAPADAAPGNSGSAPGNMKAKSPGGNSASAGSGETLNPGTPDKWGRNAFYEAGSTQEGLVFLNHFGGSGSGVFDYQFGNSISFAKPDGCGGASSPQKLDDCLLPSNKEIIIMSDKKCSDGSCGYFRPGTADVAYHGFGGCEKAFFFEFMMPTSSEPAAANADMPAIWSLNAQIPRTLQYGKPECSCWTTGCGEFDIFEVLSTGCLKMKSTMHGNKAGGSSDYFPRPVSKYVKGAMIMSDDEIKVVLLPDGTNFDFPQYLSKADLQAVLKGAANTSRFTLTGASSG